MKEKIEEIIKNAIEEVNAQLDENEQINYSSSIRFIGKEACMDSVSLVTFILTIEELVSDSFDMQIQLVTDKAFSADNSPFYSIETLSLYIESLLG